MAAMPDRYRAPGGLHVQVVSLENTPDHRDGAWIRITRCGSWVADVRTVDELEKLIPLDQLEPDGGDLARRPARPEPLAKSWPPRPSAAVFSGPRFAAAIRVTDLPQP